MTTDPFEAKAEQVGECIIAMLGSDWGTAHPGEEAAHRVYRAILAALRDAALAADQVWLEAIKAHRLIKGSDLVGYHGRCSCGLQGEPFDIEEESEYYTHLADAAAAIRAREGKP